MAIESQSKVLEGFHESWGAMRDSLFHFFQMWGMRDFSFPKEVFPFWIEGNDILQSIARQCVEWEKFQKRLPVGEPLHFSSFSKHFLRITSPFGKRRDPFAHQWAFHTGVDFEAEQGGPVYATGDGKIGVPSKDPAYGYNVVIEHAYGFSSVYAHLSRVQVRGLRHRVLKGEIIGFVGMTGRSTGTHLHYEIKNRGIFLDPLDFLRWGKSLS